MASFVKAFGNAKVVRINKTRKILTAIKNKFPENDYLFPPIPESSRLIVGCRREDYSASRIAHAVEDCNAHLLNLNVTSFDTHTAKFNDDDDFEASDAKFPVVFDIRVSHRNAESIRRSLERYGYTVLASRGSDDIDGDDDIFKRRIDELFRYLEI